HVVLREFFVDREVGFFNDYVRTYTDLPFLIQLKPHGEDGAYVPGKFLTAADLVASGAGAAGAADEAAWKAVVLDGAHGQPYVPNGSIGFRYADSGEGKWNLDLQDVVPSLSAAQPGGPAAEVLLPAFEQVDGSGVVLRRGVPVRRVGDRLVTTVYDLLLA